MADVHRIYKHKEFLVRVQHHVSPLSSHLVVANTAIFLEKERNHTADIPRDMANNTYSSVSSILY